MAISGGMANELSRTSGLHRNITLTDHAVEARCRPVAGPTDEQNEDRMVAHHVLSQVMTTAILPDGTLTQGDRLQTTIHSGHEILHSYGTTQLRINTTQNMTMTTAHQQNHLNDDYETSQ